MDAYYSLMAATDTYDRAANKSVNGKLLSLPNPILTRKLIRGLLKKPQTFSPHMLVARLGS